MTPNIHAPLFGPFSSITVSTLAARFFVQDGLIYNDGSGLLVRIGTSSEEFEAAFFGDGGLIEIPASESLWRSAMLDRNTLGEDVYLGLGGEESLVSLGFVLSLAEHQTSGEAGRLRVDNDRTNICYARDIRGVPQTVSVSWHGLSGWRFYAHPVRMRAGCIPAAKVFTAALW